MVKARVERKTISLWWSYPWLVTLPNCVAVECRSWAEAMKFVADYYREEHCSCFACNPGRVAR